MTKDPVLNGKYSVGVRGMRGAPMGKSVFHLMREAAPSTQPMMHQPEVPTYGHEKMPFPGSGPAGRLK